MLKAVWTTLALGSKTALSSVAVICQKGKMEVVTGGITMVIFVVTSRQSVVAVVFPR
jgi:hypothetical protein